MLNVVTTQSIINSTIIDTTANKTKINLPSPTIDFSIQQKGSGKGKKHDNSILLQKFIEQSEEENLFSPELHGLTDQQVMQFLLTTFPIEIQRIESLWKELEQLYDQDPQGFWEKEKVLQKFAEVKTLMGKIKETEFPFPEAIQQLIQKVSKIIVRSSGDEDGDGSVGSRVGAGVHESVGNVEPNVKAVTSAMSAVISSYFSLHAMRNKALEGNPFRVLPPLSVMIQEFIGETENSIPVSAVMATNELLYVDCKSSRVTTLNAVHGFGDGITGGLVVNDSVVIVKSKKDSGNIIAYYENRDKQTRMVGKKEVDNPEELRFNPALNEAMLTRLYRIAGKLQNFFGRSMDVELVIVGENIYLVQARDLKRSLEAPSYLKNLPKTSLSCVPAIPTAAKVSIVKDPQAICEALTLEDAEKKFNASQHTHVIVQRRPGEYTHSAIFFSSLEKKVPCFCMDPKEWNPIFAKCSPETPIIFDVQQEICCLGNGENIHIQDGWYSHPCGLKLSLNLAENRPAAGLEPLKPSAKIAKELHLIRSEDPEVANAAALALRKHLYIHLDLEKVYDSTHYKAVAAKLQEVANKILDEITTLIQDPDSSYLDRLHHIKMLERVLFQTRGTDTSLSTFSIAGLSKELELNRHSTFYLKYAPNGQLAHEASFLDEALTNEVKIEWLKFLKSIESSEHLPEFKRMMKDIEQLGILPLWMLFFDEARKQAKSEQLLENLLQLFGPNEKNLCEQLHEIKKQIGSVRHRVLHSNDENTFHQSWKGCVQLMKNMSMLASYQNSSPIGQILILQTLEEVLTVVDMGIKEGRKSGILKGKALVKEIRSRVSSLISFIGPWGNTLVQGDTSKYVNKMKTALKETSDQAYELESRSNFNVSTKLWGANNGSQGTNATRIEEIFTKAHQSMLVWIADAMNQLLEQKILEKRIGLPPMLKAFIWHRSMVKAQNFECIGIRVDEKEFSLRYNLPVQTHSMGLEVAYDKQTGKTSFKIQVFGWMYPRGLAIRDYLASLSIAENRVVIDPPQMEEKAGIFHVKWEVRSEEELMQFIEDFVYVEDLTMVKDYEDKLALKWWNRFTQDGQDVETSKKILSYIMDLGTANGTSYFPREVVMAWLQKHAENDLECKALMEKYCDYVVQCFIDTSINVDKNCYYQVAADAFSLLKNECKTERLWEASAKLFNEVVSGYNADKQTIQDFRHYNTPLELKLCKLKNLFEMLFVSKLPAETEKAVTQFLSEALNHKDPLVRELGVIILCDYWNKSGWIASKPRIFKMDPHLIMDLIKTASTGIRPVEVCEALEEALEQKDMIDTYGDQIVEMADCLLPNANAQILTRLIRVLNGLTGHDQGTDVAVKAIKQLAQLTPEEIRETSKEKSLFKTLEAIADKDLCKMEVVYICLSFLEKNIYYHYEKDILNILKKYEKLIEAEFNDLNSKDPVIREHAVLAFCTLWSYNKWLPECFKKDNNSIGSLIQAAEDGIHTVHVLETLELVLEKKQKSKDDDWSFDWGKGPKNQIFIDSYENELREMANHIIPKADAKTLKRLIELLEKLTSQKKGMDMAAMAIKQLAKFAPQEMTKNDLMPDGLFHVTQAILKKEECIKEIVYIYLSYLAIGDCCYFTTQVVKFLKNHEKLIEEEFIKIPELRDGIRKMREVSWSF